MRLDLGKALRLPRRRRLLAPGSSCWLQVAGQLLLTTMRSRYVLGLGGEGGRPAIFAGVVTYLKISKMLYRRPQCPS
jgi:hypothetical protein